jgi:hypothetical protein
MATLTPQDVAIRLFYSKCCVGDQAGKFVTKLKRGTWSQADERKMNLVSALTEVIEGYCPIGGNVTEDDNFILDADAQHIFEVISELCGVCFAPIGHNYE